MKNQDTVCVANLSRSANLSGRRGWIVVLSLLLTLPAMGEDEPAADTEDAEAEAPVSIDEGFADYFNWLDVSVGGSVVGGNEAAFQQRQGLPANTAFGGIEDFHYEKFLPKDWMLEIEGRALFDYNDYDVKLDLTREDRGFFRAGYREFRTYYNGSGGYLPGDDLWMPLSDPDLHVDRGHAWLEGGLTLPDLPKFSVRYDHQFREGQKDSTIWGRVSSSAGVRGINASFYDLDETRDIISGQATHTIGKTDIGLKVGYESARNQNSLNANDLPGTPDSFMTQEQDLKSDLFNAHAWSSTWFNNRTVLSAGYGFTRLDTDLTGSRIYGDQYDPVYDPSVIRGPGFINLSGNSQLNQHLANLSFMTWPMRHLAVVPSVRFDYQDMDGVSLYVPNNPGVTAGTDVGGIIIPDPNATGEVNVDHSRRNTTLAEALELRYTGVTNWLFYARGDWDQGDGNIQEESRPIDANVISAPQDATVQRQTDYWRFTQKYTAGANWYPLRRLSLSGQYYFKARDNSYDHPLDSTDNSASSFNRYPAYLRQQDSYTHDANIRLTWRPLATLSSVTRYDFQRSTIDTQADQLSSVESAEITSHILSQSLTWSPLTQLFLQGTLNLVFDQADTPVSDQGTGVVQTSENNYWFATLGAGYALTRKTDLLVDYSYYRADNYDPGNWQVSVPYGAGAEEHNIGVSLIQRISERMRLTLRYGFFTYDDETSGGNNNFDAHVISTGLQYRF